MQSSAPSTGSLSASIRSAEWSEVEEEEEKNKKSKALSRMIDEMKGMRATEEGDGAINPGLFRNGLQYCARTVAWTVSTLSARPYATLSIPAFSA